MVCAVDPSVDNAEQTLTTLRYADQAKRIVTRPVENIDLAKREARRPHPRPGPKPARDLNPRTITVAPALTLTIPWASPKS